MNDNLFVAAAYQITYDFTMSSLGDKVELPNGLVFPNRLIKASMAEMMCGQGNVPNSNLFEAYKQWGEGGWGAILTGNVQVDVNHLGTPVDPAIHGESPTKSPTKKNDDVVKAWRDYAQASQRCGSPTIVQLNHPGRQSLRIAGKRGIFGPTIAPSPVPLVIDDNRVGRFISCVTFPAPREMTQSDIDTVTRQFTDAAKLMADSGFSGIELHGAHGYLIDQFLNPKANLRTDAYGGSPENRTRFLLDIIKETRKVVPATFCIGVKLNSADHSSSSFEETMSQIGLLVVAGIDFLEVSGGSYTNPEMMNTIEQQKETRSARTVAREAFFLEFATETRKRYPGLVLMLTGGFRTRKGIEDALTQNACDLVGIARPAAIDPRFPLRILNKDLSDEEAQLPLQKVPSPWYTRAIPGKAVGMGLETTYYANQIQRRAKGLQAYPPS